MQKLFHAGRYATYWCVFTGALWGCAAIAPQPPAAGPLQPDGAARTAKSHGGLLYVGTKRTVEVFTYPSGTLRQTLRTPPGSILAMCSDSKGDVFITSAGDSSSGSAGYVYEYAHGGTSPIAALDAPPHYVPVSCSSDPTTGNLAVTAYKTNNFTPLVAVYAGASGMPQTYTSRALGANPQAAYDDGGNLFVTSGGNVGSELLAGEQSLKKITFDETLGGAAHLQWDGEYFALQSFDVSKYNREREVIDRLAISGSKARVKGTSHFTGWMPKDPGQCWIVGDTIVGTPADKVPFWNYPAGGEAYKTLHPSHASQAITVSLTP